MKIWTIKEAKRVLAWARTPEEERPSLEELAAELGRTPDGVRRFLRRLLPQGQRPWTEKRRWTPAELEAVRGGKEECAGRSAAAKKKYLERHRGAANGGNGEGDFDSLLTVSQVASDTGLPRARIYRLLKSGLLRRFKGRIAQTSFEELLREHPEVIPYCKLSRDQKEWLVVNGYSDPSLGVKRPSSKGLLDS